MHARRAAVVLTGVLICALPATAVHAAPPDPGPPPAPPALPGPWPPSEVLAQDPETVRPPDPGVTTFAASCPPTDYGVRRSAPGSGRTVALTFDDGPGADTVEIMQILEDEGVAATFFNIGVNMNARPGLLRAEASQQFLLGNHTWSHPDMTRLSASAQAGQMADATAQQRAIVGFEPCWFRPPYGAYDSTTLSVAQDRNLEVWNWSVDTQDWMADSASQFWVDRIVRRARAGGSQQNPVVLMHNSPDGDQATVRALPRIIAYYRALGFTFVDLEGRVADRYVTGDWDGDGRSTPGVVRGRTWYLRNSNSPGPADIVLDFGYAGDRVVTGDWNGDGVTTPGVVRGSTWYLRDTNDPGNGGKSSVRFGNSSYLPVPGDWDGDGTSAPGVYRNGVWHLRGGNGPNEGKLVLRFGAFGYRPVSGDWDGDGDTTPGVVRDDVWHQRDGIGPSDGSKQTLRYATATDRPISGDWDGDGTTTPGIVRGGDGWYLRSTNTSGGADWVYTFGP